MHADDAFAKEAAALDQRGKSKRQTVAQMAMEWLPIALASGPRPSAEVAEEGNQHGFDKRMLQRALRELGGKPEKLDFAGGWIWSLPSGFELPKATSDPSYTLDLSSSREVLL